MRRFNISSETVSGFAISTGTFGWAAVDKRANRNLKGLSTQTTTPSNLTFKFFVDVRDFQLQFFSFHSHFCHPRSAGFLLTVTFCRATGKETASAEIKRFVACGTSALHSSLRVFIHMQNTNTSLKLRDLLKNSRSHVTLSSQPFRWFAGSCSGFIRATSFHQNGRGCSFLCHRRICPNLQGVRVVDAFPGLQTSVLFK